VKVKYVCWCTIFLLILSVLMYSLQLGYDIAWAIRNNIPIFKMLKHIHNFYAPIYMAFFTYIAICTKPTANWKQILSAKLWLPPCLAITLFSLIQWRLDIEANFDTSILGLNWQWCAIATWSVLFMALLLIYGERVDPACSWLLSLCSVGLAGIFYEVPWYAINGKLATTLTHPQLIIQLPTFLFLLYWHKWTPQKTLLLTVLPVIALWLLWGKVPFWLPRLSTFPFFISIPYGIKVNT